MGTHTPSNFSAIVRCGQTVGWTKMSLGMEVGLTQATLFSMGSGDPATPRKKGHTHRHPIFGPCLLWSNGWMDEDAIWYGSKSRYKPHCIRRGPSCPRKGHVFAHVICGHGRPSQLLLSSCTIFFQLEYIVLCFVLFHRSYNNQSL